MGKLFKMSALVHIKSKMKKLTMLCLEAVIRFYACLCQTKLHTTIFKKGHQQMFDVKEWVLCDP